MTGEKEEKDVDTTHYYGDLIRKLFIVGAVVMLLGLPAMKAMFGFPIYAALIAILALGFLAGLTSPRQPWVNWLNLITSVIAFLVFETYAVTLFLKADEFWFVANQFEALIFLAAIYYSTKTVRAMF